MVAIGSGTDVASAAAPPRNGATQETAAPSCWSIKQNYPTSVDGIYWLRTNTLVQPTQVYCDMTTDGGGWVLIGRGRDGWSFAYDGQGNPADGRATRSPVPAAFAPAALSTETVNGLMNGGRMDGLTDGLRVRRARNSDRHDLAGRPALPVELRHSGRGRSAAASTSTGCASTATCANISSTGYGGQQHAHGRPEQQRPTAQHLPGAEPQLAVGFWYGSGVSGGANNADQLPVAVHDRGPTPPVRPGVHPAADQRSRRHQCAVARLRRAGDDGPADARRQPGHPALAGHEPQCRRHCAALRTCSGSPSSATRSSSAASSARYSTAPAAQKIAQSYLAAFDKNTGEFIPSFAPVINGPVHELKVTPDGKLIVAGEFTTVNGVASSGLVALNPTTGATITTWIGQRQSRAAASPYVRAMDIEGNWLYIGGSFIEDLGRRRQPDGQRQHCSSPALGRAARRDVEAEPHRQRVWEIEATPERVYVVGVFRQLNGVNLPVPRQAILNTVNGTLVPGLQNYQANADTERQQTIMEVGDSVYQGGSQHFLHKYAKSDYSFQRSHLTLRGGDFQSMSYTNGIVYASNHSNNWNFSDTNTWSTPSGYSRVDPINLIGAYDADDPRLPARVPAQLDVRGRRSVGAAHRQRGLHVGRWRHAPRQLVALLRRVRQVLPA